MTVRNKVALFIAIEGYRNGDISEALMIAAVDSYTQSLQQTPVSGSVEESEDLFKEFCDEQGMDDDQIRACSWYKAGMINYTQWLLERLTIHSK